MGRPAKNYKGLTVGCLTVADRVATLVKTDGAKRAVWAISCSCGARHERSSEYLRRARKNPPVNCEACSKDPKVRARHAQGRKQLNNCEIVRI